MPITYVICFLTAYYGPNAEILGNVKASIWHYRAVAEPVAYLQNIFIFFLVDFSSGVINGILLWTTCKINVFTVLKNMQKTFWLIWATQEAALYLEVKIKLCARIQDRISGGLNWFSLPLQCIGYTMFHLLNL